MAETKTNIPVEIKMGNAGTNDANLPAFKEGSIIFTKDTKKIYIDPVGETERVAVGGQQADSELSETSENPVQNKVITNAMVGKKFGTSEVFNDYENNKTYLYDGVRVTNVTSTTNSSTFTLESVAGLAAGGTFNIAYKSDNNSGINLHSTQFTIASVDTTNKTITTTTKYSGPPTSIYLLYVVNSTATDATPLYAACTHAEGQKTKAIGFCGHAEGESTQATGGCSHAEGQETQATGTHSHAEGLSTTASGSYSHSQNFYTRAGYDYQTVMGINNINKSDTLLEVGNGSIQTASNAFEVYRDGHAEVQTQGTTDNSVVIKKSLDGKQDKIGTVSYASSPKYLMLNINGYVDPTSGKFIQLSPSDINATHINVTNAEISGKVKFDNSLIIGNVGVFGFDFELPTTTTPGKIKTGNPSINKLNFSNGLGTLDIQLGGIKNGTADNDAVNVSQLNQKLDKQETRQYEGVSQEHAQLGTTEIISAQTGTWVTDGWTGNATTGFTHTSGNTSVLKYPITGSDYAAEGTLYDITFNCSIAPTVDNIMVRIGNSNVFNLYGQEEPLNIGVKSKGSTDGTIYLEFIPSSTFTGTISNIEVHKITGAYEGKYKITDNYLATSFEVRAGNHNRYNAFIGIDSGSYNTTGNGNVGFGYKALANNTSGFWNTGIGFEALQFVNAGSRNIGIGALAGRHIETGQRNVVIGTHAFRENRTGNYNIAIGADSQLNGKSGNSNISIGGSSLYYIDGGNENIAIGHNAIAGNNTENKGNYNIAIGFNSLTYGSNSIDNIAIGRNAGYRITGSNNVIIGTDSGRRGNSQVVMGANSGKNLQDDATENTIIGFYTGNNLKANKNCILIGNRVDGEETGDYQLNIGNLIKGSTQSSNKYVNIDGSLSAKNMSVDNVGTNDIDVVNKKYVDDAIGNIIALFASLVDMTKTTQADEPVNDTEIVNEPTVDEGGLS